jgi:hypothetical protein
MLMYAVARRKLEQSQYYQDEASLFHLLKRTCGPQQAACLGRRIMDPVVTEIVSNRCPILLEYDDMSAVGVRKSLTEPGAKAENPARGGSDTKIS